MIRRILVPTDGGDAAALGVQFAVSLAAKCRASLCGLNVVDVKLLEGPFLRDLSASLGTAPYVNYQGNITMLLQERGKAALESFRQACAEAEVPCETIQVTGIVAREIVEQSSLFDLVVLGRHDEQGAWLEGLLGSTTEAVIRRSQQPVLVTGADHVGAGVLVAAYDGSGHADHALKVAVNLAESWGAPLHILAVDGGGEDAGLEAARRYVDAHEIDVAWVCRAGDPREEILAYVGDAGASLLVMGAYGHSKVRELVLGSTTNYMMHRAPCPLLLVR